MSDENQAPQPFPVRKVGDQDWEVLIATRDTWVSCENEKDARLIAKGPVLEYESLERTRAGSAFANELEELADTLQRYNMFGDRFFRRRAGEARPRG